jgi:hypothetical protein
MQARTQRVDGARAVPRQPLEGDQRRAPAGRALVVEAAPEELELPPEAELPDRAEGDGPLAVVRAAGSRLDLVLPLPPQVRELPLLALLGEGLGLSGCLLEGQVAWPPLSDRGAGPT